MEMQTYFEIKLKEVGVKKPELGKPFTSYQTEFIKLSEGKTNSSEVKVKHLHLRVGGEYRRAKVAYQLLTENQEKNRQIEIPAPAFFEQFITDVEQSSRLLWPHLSEHIDRIVAERVQYADSTRMLAEQQLFDAEEYLSEVTEEKTLLTQYVEELQRQLQSQEDEHQAYLDALVRVSHLEALMTEKEKRLNILKSERDDLYQQASQYIELKGIVSEKNKQQIAFEQQVELLEVDRQKQHVSSGRLSEKYERLEAELSVKQAVIVDLNDKVKQWKDEAEALKIINQELQTLMDSE